MKEPAGLLIKVCLEEDVLALNQIDYGSFITIPNPFRQFQVQNLITPESPLKSVCFNNTE